MEKSGKYRKKAREILFRTLYTYDLKGGDIFEILEEHIKDIRDELSPEVLEYAYSIAKGIMDALEDIDKILRENLKGWRLERLGYPERALLRLGTYELVFSDVPDKGRVFIDILDLAKCYLDNEDSLKFINGVLSTIYKKYQQDVKV
ncbi:transcription antitermination factor NusB [Persephonella sp. IF05-L8]|uniref:transcription antitermination factor NusB n=1 Tax=Persephonella sp. IF05-L8 TaxID=1158338 RepID=UPI000494E42A